MNLNADFILKVKGVYSEEGELWLQRLPLKIQELSQKWGFQFLHPLPDLTYSFVGLVVFKGQKVILKMTPSKEGIFKEVKWLHSMSHCAPEVYGFDEDHNAFLMEYLEPGYTLKTLVKEGKDDLATQIICQTIQGLHEHQNPTTHFPHISEFIKDLPILKGHLEDRLLSYVQGLFQELTQDRTNDVLLHGDLHHDNILLSGNAWKAIDPHGYIGDPCAEVGCMIKNPLDAFPQNLPLKEIVQRRLDLMNEHLPFEKERIQSWALCLTTLSAAWSLQDQGILTLEKDVIQALDELSYKSRKASG